MTIAPRTPTYRHWKTLKVKTLKAYLQPVQGERMEVEKFLDIWNVSQEELASIHAL